MRRFIFSSEQVHTSLFDKMQNHQVQCGDTCAVTLAGIGCYVLDPACHLAFCPAVITELSVVASDGFKNVLSRPRNLLCLDRSFQTISTRDELFYGLIAITCRVLVAPRDLYISDITPTWKIELPTDIYMGRQDAYRNFLNTLDDVEAMSN